MKKITLMKKAASFCGVARELFAVLAQAVTALVPAYVKIPLGCHNLAAVISALQHCLRTFSEPLFLASSP